MKKKIINILKYLSFLGLGVFLVWWSLHQIPAGQWKDFKMAFSTARYGLLIPVFFILSSSHFLRSVRWRTLIQPLGYNPSPVNTFFAVMIGYLANLAVPRLGEVLKCTILAKYEQVPAEKLLGTIVAERAFDLVCLALVFFFAFALQFQEIGGFGINLLKRLFLSKGGHFNFTVISITIICLLLVLFIIKRLFRQFSHLSFIITLKRIIRGIWQGIISI